MLTTEKIKSGQADAPKKGVVVIVGNENYIISEVDITKPEGQQKTMKIVKPKTGVIDPAAFTSVDKRETRAVKGPMLTTADYKDRLEAAKPKPKAVKKTRGRRKKK